MSIRRTSLLAVVLFAVSMIGIVCSLALTVADNSLLDLLQSEFVFYVVALGSVAVVGLLLTTHRPRNPIGWIFLAASIAQMIIVTTDRYADFIAGDGSDNPLELTVLFWFTNWVWIVAFLLPFTFGFLLFPTGRLPSRRWRFLAWIGGSQLLLLILAAIMTPGPLEGPAWPHEIANPTGIEALRSQIEFAWGLAIGLAMLFVLGSAVSLFIRLRGATAQERQQLKWLAYAASIAAGSFLIATLESEALSTNVGEYIFVLGIAAQPIAIGLAILRHNLYDIDRLINRTIVYGSLTALLLLSFAANVLIFQLILEPFTRGNDLAVAGSTLLVFVVFRPLRDRLQSFVDRRFYRQQYDAQRTLQSFGVTARDAVDLDQLSTELTGVISTTIQPAHVSIWLRTGTAREDKG